MTGAVPVSMDEPAAALRFVSFADQAMFLALSARGQHPVIQLLWRYLRPVDLEALTRFRDNLAHGQLARLIRPALLPIGRHQWVGAPLPSPFPGYEGSPLAPELLLAWADAQVDLPLDPQHGPAWNFSAQNFTDGSTAVSLVVSHCIADGMAIANAVNEAVHGERRTTVYPTWPGWSPHRVAVTLAQELRRLALDAPSTVRALTRLFKSARLSRGKPRKPSAAPNTGNDADEMVVFPSTCVRVPASDWDQRAQSLGGDRLTLLTAMTACFAEALGRVCDDEVTLLIPVNERERRSRTDGNRVSLATLNVPAGIGHRRLDVLQRRLRAALVRTRREPNDLGALLPLAPFVPSRAFSAASHLALAPLATLPVTLSNLGALPVDALPIDGAAVDHICFRGVDHRVSRRQMNARQGVATLFSGALPGFLHLTFVAYQPGMITETQQLRGLVEQILAKFDLTGEYFDA